MSEPKVQRVGVVDVGGARLKATVWLNAERPTLCWREVVDTGNLVKADRSDELQALLKALIARARSQCDLLIGYGGAQLRDAVWRERLFPILDEFADQATVLTPYEEGALLLRAARRGQVTASHLLDIGGGSVQLISEPAGQEATVQSWPYGTYALETRFGLEQGSPLSDYHNAADYLREEMQIERSPGARLAIGTSPQFMRLLPALAARTGGMAASESWTTADLERGWQFCAQLDPEAFRSVLPDDSGFMLGADKAILVASIVAEKLRASTIVATDASVMLGVACEHFDTVPLVN